MTTLVALDPAVHGDLRVDTRPDAALGDWLAAVGVVPAEFAALIAAYPIFLRKNTHTGQFEPCALVGLAAGENLFVADGVWDAGYIPLQRQSQPFALMPDGAGGRALAIDPASPRLGTALGEILFTATGHASAHLAQVRGMLEALLAGSRVAHAWTARLEALDLIEPVTLDLAFADRSEARLDGLYTVRAEGLRALAGPALAALHRDGYLELCWYQQASLVHVQSLLARKNRRLAG